MRGYLSESSSDNDCHLKLEHSFPYSNNIETSSVLEEIKKSQKSLRYPEKCPTSVATLNNVREIVSAPYSGEDNYVIEEIFVSEKNSRTSKMSTDIIVPSFNHTTATSILLKRNPEDLSNGVRKISSVSPPASCIRTHSSLQQKALSYQKNESVKGNILTAHSSNPVSWSNKSFPISYSNKNQRTKKKNAKVRKPSEVIRKFENLSLESMAEGEGFQSEMRKSRNIARNQQPTHGKKYNSYYEISELSSPELSIVSSISSSPEHLKVTTRKLRKLNSNSSCSTISSINSFSSDSSDSRSKVKPIEIYKEPILI